MALLRQAAKLLRRSAGRLALLTICAGLIVGILWLPLSLIGSVISDEEIKEKISTLAEPFLWAVAVPLGAGYTYTLLLLVWGQRPGVSDLWEWIDGPGRYLNVLLAGSVPSLVGWLAGVSALFLPLQLPGVALFGYTVPDWLLRAGIRWGAYMVMLPFTFAAINALVLREKFPKAIVHSVVLAVRSWRLFFGLLLMRLALVAVTVAALVPFVFVLAAVSRQAEGLPPVFICVLPPLALSGLVVGQVLLVYSQVADALFYQEFVWREREAAARPTESA